MPVKARKMKVEEIIDQLGPPPSTPETPRTEDMYQEVIKVYHEMYAYGFDAFFESNWFYFKENGKMSFPQRGNLLEHMAAFLNVLEGVKVSDHNQMVYSGILETRIVWELAKMAAVAAPENADNRMRATLPPDDDAIEVKNRFTVVEALLCGDFLYSNPLTPPLHDANHHRVRQFDFWYQLGELVRRHSGQPNSSSDTAPRDEALNKLRWLLDGRENRDVLYSIAVLRHLAPRFDPTRASQARYHVPETDPENKVAVATKFLLAQAQVTGGTTNVVRRFSDIGARAFVNPGMNIAGRFGSS